MANEQLQCLDLLIKEVKQELTVACQLPINIPTKEITRIIKYAKQWFWKHYETAVEEKYFVILDEMWSRPEYKETRSVKLPENIFSVHGLYELGKENFGNNGWNSMDKDFSLDKFIYGNMYQPGLQSESLMYYVVNESFYDLSRRILVNKISYDFNRLTHNLRFMGDQPKRHVVLRIYQYIDDCSLFSDEIFYRYVVAQCKVQISRVLGTFNFELPGSITLNYDLIRDEGKEEIESIREQLKSEEGTDWFFAS